MIRILALTAMAALSACSFPVSENTRGAQLYGQFCTVCHGASGHGDGQLAKDLDVVPTDLTLLSHANGGQFPTEEVMAQIFGYPGRFEASGMPEFGPVLAGAPVDYKTRSGEIIPTPQGLIDLTVYLKSIQQQPEDIPAP